MIIIIMVIKRNNNDNDDDDAGELGYDRLNGTSKIVPSYAKSVVYI